VGSLSPLLRTPLPGSDTASRISFKVAGPLARSDGMGNRSSPSSSHQPDREAGPERVQLTTVSDGWCRLTLAIPANPWLVTA